MTDIKEDIQALKKYFKYNPKEENMGYGFFIITFVLLLRLGGKSLWIFILPLLCLSYIGYRIIIIVSIIALNCLIYYIYTAPADDLLLKNNDFFLITGCIAYYRDMFFIYKYKTNLNSEKSVDTKKDNIVKVIFTISTLVFCVLIYLLTQVYLL